MALSRRECGISAPRNQNNSNHIVRLNSQLISHSLATPILLYPFQNVTSTPHSPSPSIHGLDSLTNISVTSHSASYLQPLCTAYQLSNTLSSSHMRPAEEVLKGYKR